MGGGCLRRQFPSLKLGPSDVTMSHTTPPAIFFAFGAYVMYISMFLHMLMYRENLCPYISSFPHPQPQ
jgi:hypothetical protein